jgi:hypothetical protein
MKESGESGGDVMVGGVPFAKGVWRWIGGGDWGARARVLDVCLERGAADGGEADGWVE